MTQSAFTPTQSLPSNPSADEFLALDFGRYTTPRSLESPCSKRGNVV
jgi:hypothetical protein